MPEKRKRKRSAKSREERNSEANLGGPNPEMVEEESSFKAVIET